jgi:aldehyde dehydrogenase family 9 protein A1
MTFEVVKDLSAGLYFFNGKRQTIQGSETFPVYEARSGEVVAQCPSADAAHVDKIVDLAAEAQPQWGRLTPIERGKVLNRVADLIREHLEELAVWEVKTNGKPITEARIDIEASADMFQFYAGIAPAVLKGDYFDLPSENQTRFAYTRREPLGVVGCIGAWNYPFLLCVWKVAPALAGGNAVVFKPSPFAPASPVLLGELLKAAGLPDGVYNVVQGEGKTGEALCLNEKIAKVSFTGSVGTGKLVQQNCAKRSVKPVTLELGGKSPLIIFEDAEISNAISASILANFFNQGEVCTNATRVFVHNSLVEKYTAELLEVLKKLKVGDPLHEETKVGATINEPHLKRVLGFVERAQAQGAKVLRGGKRVNPEGVEKGFYFDPAVITNLKDDMEIVKDEIFGAVLLILPFENEAEVIQRANNTSYGLAAGLYTKDVGRAHRVAAKLQAGTVFINTYNDCDVNVPFGGYKSSGHGRENCIEALHAYTQIKAIYVNTSDTLEHHL